MAIPARIDDVTESHTLSLEDRVRKVLAFARQGKRIYREDAKTKELRDYQSKIFSETIAHLAKNPVAIFEAATGTGKTLVMKYIIEHWLKSQTGKVLYVVHSEDLIDNLKSEFGLNDPNFPVPAKKCDPRSRIHHITIQSLLALMKKNEAAYRLLCSQYSLVCWDECHRYPFEGKQWSVIVQDFYSNGAKSVGGSATVSRMDDHPILFHDHENHICSIYPIETGVREGWLSEIYGLVVQTHVTPSREVSTSSELRMKFSHAGLLERARVIHQTLKLAASEQGRECLQTVLFVRTVEEAASLKEEFDRMGDLGEIAVVTGKVKSFKRQEIYDAFIEYKINMIINVQVVTEGVNLPNCEVVAMARATFSTNLYNQSLGRGTRKPDGPDSLKQFLLVIDFVDNIRLHHFRNLVTASSLGNRGLSSGPVLTQSRAEEREDGVIVDISSQKMKLYGKQEWMPYEQARNLIRLFRFKNMGEYKKFTQEGCDTSHLGTEVELEIKKAYDRLGLSSHYQL